jgi:flagellar biosynthesis/type III secretory pathway protein FliH
MITPEDKNKVQERLDVFDQLIEEDEYIQQQRALGREEGLAEGKAEGVAEGETKGEIRATRSFLVYVTNKRFPSLVELAQQKAERTTQLSTLNEIIRLIDNAPDEAIAQYILSSPSAA